MTKSKPQEVILASQEELLQEPYYRRLWIATVALSIPRRQLLDTLADTFRDYQGMIFTPEGNEFELPDLDAVFGEDPDVRWFSQYLDADAGGIHPRIRTRKFKRLQLLDLFFKIRFPDVAQHFAR